LSVGDAVATCAIAWKITASVSAGKRVATSFIARSYAATRVGWSTPS
jgi:hypothetical protein